MANPREEIHKGDTGTIITVTVLDSGTPVDVSAATVTAFLESPSGTVTEVSTTDTNGGADGKVDITTTGSTFDEDGVWKIQMKVVNAGNVWRSDIIPQRIWPNLSDS